MLVAVFATLSISNIGEQSAYAALCSGKYYATHAFYPSTTKQPNGSQAEYKVFQNVVNNGAVTHPLWVRIVTTNTLFEIGWQDLLVLQPLRNFIAVWME
jgi:hypothetical protein